MAKHIISLMPPHFCYIEVFGGAGNVLLQKPPSKVEVFNDYDEDIYVVWKVMRDRGDEVVKMLSRMLYHENIFRQIRAEWKSGYKGEDEVERAVRFLYLLNITFAGKPDLSAFGYSFSNNKAKSFFRKVINYGLLIKRLRNVQIICKDFRDVIERASKRGDKVLLYLDPPYYGAEHYYNLKFTFDDHKDLADLLNKTTCKFILSYYNYPYLHDFYPPNKFYYFEFSNFKSSYYQPSQSFSRPAVTEIIITNFKPENRSDTIRRLYV